MNDLLLSLFVDLEDDGLVDCEFVEGFRSRYGTYQFGHLEEDPEQLEYEELMNLGESLGGRNEY